MENKFCRECGKGISINAYMCPSCGEPVVENVPMKKSKTIAVILAVIFGQWTWLYTYKKDADKFWVGMLFCFIGLFLAFIPNIIVWIVSIVDAVSKDSGWYNKY